MVSRALLKSSAVSTRPMQPKSRHHSTSSQRRTIAVASTRAAKKKCTEKLEWPRTPSLIPRKAAPNLWCQGRRGRRLGESSTGGSEGISDTGIKCLPVRHHHPDGQDCPSYGGKSFPAAGLN